MIPITGNVSLRRPVVTAPLAAPIPAADDPVAISDRSRSLRATPRAPSPLLLDQVPPDALDLTTELSRILGESIQRRDLQLIVAEEQAMAGR